MERIDRNRQQILAIFLPVSAGLLVIGSVLTPKGLDQIILKKSTALKVLPIAAAHTNRLYFSNVLLLFGLAALGVSFATMATLVRTRGAKLATVAALIGGFGATSGALGNVLAGLNVAATQSAHLPPDVAAQFLVASFTSWVGKLLLVCYLLSLYVGLILMAIALWRSQRVPRWLPVLFAVGLGVAAVSPVGLVAIPLQLPFAVAMVLLGNQVWKMAILPESDAAQPDLTTQPIPPEASAT